MVPALIAVICQFVVNESSNPVKTHDAFTMTLTWYQDAITYINTGKVKLLSITNRCSMYSSKSSNYNNFHHERHYCIINSKQTVAKKYLEQQNYFFCSYIGAKN